MVMHLIPAHEQLQLNDLINTVQYNVLDVHKHSDYNYDIEYTTDTQNATLDDYNTIIIGKVVKLNYAKRIYWRKMWWKITTPFTDKLIKIFAGINPNTVKKLSHEFKNNAR